MCCIRKTYKNVHRSIAISDKVCSRNNLEAITESTSGDDRPFKIFKIYKYNQGSTYTKNEYCLRSKKFNPLKHLVLKNILRAYNRSTITHLKAIIIIVEHWKRSRFNITLELKYFVY
jgi:hypothetical protein